VVTKLENIEQMLKNHFHIDEKIFRYCKNIEEKIKSTFQNIDNVREYNQYKVLKAFQTNHISDSHFVSTTGYGYDDLGREALDAVYADIFGCEDALVRHNIISGTHALALCLFGILRPGDTLVSVTGKPYDTLEEVIGIRGQNNGSLKELGIHYRQIDLTKEGRVDFEKFKETIDSSTKMVLIQRSKGYGWRPSVSVSDIKTIIDAVKSINPNTVCMVDNCYGEFVETMEPTEIGADIIAGSLIKNPGGGLALTGGYIAGKKEYVTLAAYRLTTPGIGKECGATLGMNRSMFQGIFMAPHIVAESMKTAVFCAAVFQNLGFDVCPGPEEHRTDIIQAVKFGNPELVIRFCQGIQKGSPIDSFVEPQPWNMPGYDSQVIMAAGAFVQGASIELSADAPIKPPYIAYMQGGLTWEHGKLGIMTALQHMVNNGLIHIP